MDYSVKRIHIYNIYMLIDIVKILKKCGDDMYAKYNLTHWKNSYFKTLLIVFYTALKNDVYACVDKDSGSAVATFQTICSKKRGVMHFSKLAVSPDFSGMGIGSFCLEQIEKTAKEQQIYTLRCEVYDKSEHAKKFYAGRGYKTVGSINTLKYNELILEKELKKETV